ALTIYADAAVHAQREVDVEPVEDVDLAGAGRAFGFDGLLVRVDVDAPVGAFAGAEHAGGAVRLEQGDDASAAFGQFGFALGVLAGDGTARGGARGGRETAEEAAAGNLHDLMVADGSAVIHRPRSEERRVGKGGREQW